MPGNCENALADAVYLLAPNGVYNILRRVSATPRGPTAQPGLGALLETCVCGRLGCGETLHAARTSPAHSGTCPAYLCSGGVWPAGIGGRSVWAWPSGASDSIYRGRSGAQLALATVSSVVATSLVCGCCDSSLWQPCFFGRAARNMVTDAFQVTGSRRRWRALAGRPHRLASSHFCRPWLLFALVCPVGYFTFADGVCGFGTHVTSFSSRPSPRGE